MRIDLHIHSSVSDGALSPTDVVEAAVAGRLDIIALADHDATAGIAEARRAAKGRLEVVPAIEVSSTHGGIEIHILGYLVDPDHPGLVRYAAQALERRDERMQGMIRRLEDLGISISYEAVVATAGTGMIGRPHLARALVEAGHVRTVQEAFDRYLADGGPAFLPTELLTPREAIELIHEAGGIAVWAHPPFEVLEKELGHFVDWGLEGIECYRPMNTASQTRRLEAAARAYGLLTTGGSDWHGDWNGPLGSFAVDRHRVAALLELVGI